MRLNAEHCSHSTLESVSLSRADAVRVADVFKVLSDPTRVLVLQALIDAGELCVNHLAAAVGVSQSSVSHHLRLLRNMELIRYRRSGREVIYSPDDEHVEQLLIMCAQHVAHRGAGTLGSSASTSAAGNGNNHGRTSTERGEAHDA